MKRKKTSLDSAASLAPQVDAPLSPHIPLVVPAADAARLCGVCRAQWFKLLSAGKTPAPIRLSTRKPVWLLAELRDWLHAGCPDRQTWERLRAKGGAK